MKVIELLNKIANGEETKPIDYKGEKTLTYYLFDKCGEECDDTNLVNILNDEIIEEDKKLEKIDLSEWAEITYSEDWEMLTRDFNRNSNLFVNKINEIIDYLEEKE